MNGSRDVRGTQLSNPWFPSFRYKEANRLLVSGEVGTVHKNTFSQMVKESNVELREGTQALMEDCFKRKVPVLVLSAGLGVSLYL